MAPLACDPTALDRAGATVLTTGVSLGSVISTLTTALTDTAGMAGDDPVGVALGRAYDGAAAKVIEAMTGTRNGLASIGDGVRMSAHNYALAEAMSDVTGHAATLPTPPVTAPLTAASHPPSAVGAGSSAPAGWSWVAPYIGMIWPTGDSAKLRAAAAAWTTAGATFMTTEFAAGGGTMAAIAAQQIPEGTAINKALTDASRAAISVAGQCQTIAAQLNSYAAKIDKAHAAILDLLSRICDPLTGIKEVWDLLTDEDEDEIKRIADDIKTVVDNFSQEAETLADQIKATMSAAATAAKDMAHWADKEWNHFLHGTPVGRALNQVAQTLKGVGVEGYDFLEQLAKFSPSRLQSDPVGYAKDVYGMVSAKLPLVGLGPDGGPGVAESWKAVGKDVTHWDEWGTNPAEALGKSIFDVATFALPGGPLSKLGKVGHGAADALRGLKKPPELKPPEVKPPEVTPPEVKPPPPAPKPPESGQPAPAPQGKPGPSGKPAPGPADGPLPHSPTESKPPPVEKPPAVEPPKPTATPGEPGGRAPVRAPPGDTPLPHSKPPNPFPPTRLRLPVNLRLRRLRTPVLHPDPHPQPPRLRTCRRRLQSRWVVVPLPKSLPAWAMCRMVVNPRPIPESRTAGVRTHPVTATGHVNLATLICPVTAEGHINLATAVCPVTAIPIATAEGNMTPTPAMTVIHPVIIPTATAAITARVRGGTFSLTQKNSASSPRSNTANSSKTKTGDSGIRIWMTPLNRTQFRAQCGFIRLTILRRWTANG